jgi:hypothetical protein
MAPDGSQQLVQRHWNSCNIHRDEGHAYGDHKEWSRTSMATIPKTVRVTAETALAELLDEAAREPIILERDGERFRLSRDEGIDYEPDPEYVRKMLAATAGIWADLDIDTMIREIYEAREAGSRPLDRA